MRYGIGDTETTGLKGKVVEIALIEIDPDTLQVLGKWESLIDPEIPIEPGAQAIHGITSEMVADEPTIEEWVQYILGGRFEDEWTLIGHNVQFDKKFFHPVVMDVKQTFCSLALVRERYPMMPNHKLGTVKEYFNLPGGDAHRAMGDVLTVLDFLRLELPKTGRTLKQHLAVPAKTIYAMPWGKHKGQALIDLPQDYRTWLLSLTNLDDNLRTSLMQLRKAGV